MAYADDPDYPNIVLAFPYRHCRIQLARARQGDREGYTVWVGYATGDAIAAPFCRTRLEAIRRGRRWIDRHWPQP